MSAKGGASLPESRSLRVRWWGRSGGKIHALQLRRQHLPVKPLEGFNPQV